MLNEDIQDAIDRIIEGPVSELDELNKKVSKLEAKLEDTRRDVASEREEEYCTCEWGTLGQGRMDSNRCLMHDFTRKELVEHFLDIINTYEKDYVRLKEEVPIT